MKPFVLTILDTTQIQPYIFSSNRLQEIIGASQLVMQATEDWAYETLEQLWPGRHNWVNAIVGRRKADDNQAIEQPGNTWQAELIYAGGGNTVLLFREWDSARKFTRHLTARVLTQAPGLQLLAAHAEVDLDATTKPEALGAQVILIEKDLAAKKTGRAVSQPAGGFGVSAACESTGLPAITNSLALQPNEPVRRISRQVEAKLQARDSARRRLHWLFETQLEGFYRFPSELDDLGRFYGEESYIAVVHIDGNGMGERMRVIATEAGSARDYIAKIRIFSDTTAEAGRQALKKVIAELARMDLGKLEPNGDWLPLRPLIYGGDDVTFVCRGDLGISLAAVFLQAFENYKIQIPGQPPDPLHACAGISIVKLHYPFSRAYSLAEELTRSAKKLAARGEDCSALDWHFASGGLSGSLDSIRKREYTVRIRQTDKRADQVITGELLMRPLRLYPEAYDVDGRAWFGRLEPLAQKFVLELRSGRNKAKDLRLALRAGPEAVEKFRREYDMGELPVIIPGKGTYCERGWNDDKEGKNRCGYYDVLELMDHYLPVGEPVKVEAR